jgi:hypothetical protein
MEMSVTLMTWRRAWRMSPQPMARMLCPSLDELTSCSKPGSWQRAGSSDEEMPARCKTRRKILFGMSWSNVVCSMRAGQRITWSISVPRRVAPHLHCIEDTLGGRTVVPRQWQRRARARLPSSVATSNEANRATARTSHDGGTSHAGRRG